MNNKIKVSVVMAVYNTKEQYLRLAIDSILNQTFKEFEFIIIDDKSTDGSLNVLQEYANKDVRIVLIENQENIGLTRSLNKGLKLAKGEYIARMDADDYSVPNRLERQCEFLDANLEVGIVGGYVYTGIKGKRVITACSQNPEVTKIHMMFHNAGVPHPTAMFRKVLSNGKIMLYDERILKSQDYALWAQSVDDTKIVMLNEVMLLYRIHDEQISSMPKEQVKYSAMVIKEQLEKRFDIKDADSIDIALNIYRGNNKPTYKCVKGFFEKLLMLNDEKKVFDSQLFETTLKEIRLEYLFFTRKKLRVLGMNNYSDILELFYAKNIWRFWLSYLLPKIKYDFRSKSFERKNKNLIQKAML